MNNSLSIYSNLLDLPNEILQQTFKYLPASDLESSTQVNKKFHKLCNENLQNYKNLFLNLNFVFNSSRFFPQVPGDLFNKLVITIANWEQKSLINSSHLPWIVFMRIILDDDLPDVTTIEKPIIDGQIPSILIAHYKTNWMIEKEKAHLNFPGFFPSNTDVETEVSYKITEILGLKVQKSKDCYAIPRPLQDDIFYILQKWGDQPSMKQIFSKKNINDPGAKTHFYAGITIN